VKIFGVVIAALLIGYLMGGLIPNSQLQKARDDIDSLQRLVRDYDARSRSTLSGINQLLNIPNDAGQLSTASVEEPPIVVEEIEVVDEIAGTYVEVADEVSTNDVTSVSANDNEYSLSNELQTAVSAWGVRVDLAHDSFVQSVELNHDEEIRFHVLVEAMNIRLEEAILAWVDQIKAKEYMSEEAGIRMMSDLAQIVTLTYDEMDRNLPSDWREKSGEGFSLTDLIDPNVAMPLVDVEEHLDME